MKKILLSFVLIATTSFAFAQSDFNKAMKENITKLQSTDHADDFAGIAHDFDRLGLENDSWLTYYYASYAYVKKGQAMVQANKLGEVDDTAAIAEKYALVAQSKNSTSAEIPVLLYMIHNLRMMVAPEKRFAAESALAKAQLDKAIKLDSKNPRIGVAKAQNMYLTPAEFGGSKDKSIKMYKTALEQYKSYKPKSSLDPNWGKEGFSYLVSE